MKLFKILISRLPNSATHRQKTLTDRGIDYSHIVLIIAIWPGDRIRRPEHSTVEHGGCDESV